MTGWTSRPLVLAGAVLVGVGMLVSSGGDGGAVGADARRGAPNGVVETALAATGHADSVPPTKSSFATVDDGEDAQAGGSRFDGTDRSGSATATADRLGSADATWRGDPLPATAAEPASLRARRSTEDGSDGGAEMAAIVVPTVADPLDGSVLVPPDPGTAGWYRYSSPPGSPEGTTVIVGHVDFNGHPGPFFAMQELGIGSTIDVATSDGATVDYSVAMVATVSKSELATLDLFRTHGEHLLVLISCGGEFDPVARSYSDNIVTVAAPI